MSAAGASSVAAAGAAAPLSLRDAALIFLSFAFAYFFSALVRGVTATLAPHFSAELGLNAGDLGLLAGAYFFGFAAMQLPLGRALDRVGPRRVLVGFIAAAVLGCIAFALARSFIALTVARALIGVGVSACLMAPMTTFRHRFSDTAQMRANSWMLMTGALGMAMQSLWAGPWLVQVCGQTPRQAAQGLFGINVAMLLTFMGWGVLVPRLYARGWTAQRLIARGIPVCLLVLVVAVALGRHATAWVWGLFCVTCTVVSLSQPAIGQAFPPALAGRALSAYNLLIFVGVFLLQWGIGLAVDAFRAIGWGAESSFQGSFALWGVCCAVSYLWFLRRAERPAVRLP